jgi:hypothetical protein
VSEEFAERDYHPHDMTPIGDAARRVASYTEGAARLNVYKAARDELAALDARATAAEAREAKLREALEQLDLELHEHGFTGTGNMRTIARAALETDNG